MLLYEVPGGHQMALKPKATVQPLRLVLTSSSRMVRRYMRTRAAEGEEAAERFVHLVCYNILEVNYVD